MTTSSGLGDTTLSALYRLSQNSHQIAHDGLGLNLQDSSQAFQFGVKLGAPVWQDLDGPQLGSEWFAILGAQYSW